MIKKKIDVEHSSGMIDPQGSKDNSCVLKFTSLMVFGLAKCLGLLPFNYDGSDKRDYNFKFFSVKTLLSLTKSCGRNTFSIERSSQRHILIS